jgi:hypothetical protein
MRQLGNVACVGGKRKAYKLLVIKSEGNSTFERFKMGGQY